MKNTFLTPVTQKYLHYTCHKKNIFLTSIIGKIPSLHLSQEKYFPYTCHKKNTSLTPVTRKKKKKNLPYIYHRKNTFHTHVTGKIAFPPPVTGKIPSMHLSQVKYLSPQLSQEKYLPYTCHRKNTFLTSVTRKYLPYHIIFLS